jgi:class 3 adenylate cyclase
MTPPRPETLALLEDALAAEKAGRFPDACALLRRAVDLAGDSPLGCDVRLRLGRALLQGNASLGDEALTTLDAARTLARQSGSVRQEAVAIHLLALRHRQRGELDQAEDVLAASPVQRITDTAGPELGQWLHYRGLVAGQRGELANAERLCLRAHQFYQELGHSQGLAEVCTSLANLLLSRGKSRPALAFAQQGLDLKQRLGDLYGEAVSHGTLGRVFLLQARHVEARTAFTRDLELTRAMGDVAGVGIMLNSLGEVALRLGEWEEARCRFEESLKENEAATNQLFGLLGLARAHLGASRPDEANTAAGRLAGLTNLSVAAEVFRQGSLDALRGTLAWREGDAATGEALLRRGIESLQRNNKPLDAVPWEYQLRDLLQAQKRTPEAVGVMAHALDLLAECGSEQGVRDVERWLRSVDEPALVRLGLARHVPDHLIDAILTGGLQTLPPRRQHVTVLFTDIRDYTTITEQLEPEEVVEILNEWFVEVTRAIRHHGGVVNQFIGDAIMSLFGVPESREDASADAVRAALEIRDCLAAFNLRRQALGLRQIRIGIGIHSGLVVVGFVGSYLRQTYTAVGDVVNTAARLESLTKEFGADILISEETEQEQGRFGVAETTFLGERELKGRSRSTRIFQVNGRRHPAPLDDATSRDRGDPRLP